MEIMIVQEETVNTAKMPNVSITLLTFYWETRGQVGAGV